MFPSTTTYDENRLWGKKTPENSESGNFNDRKSNDIKDTENFSERERLEKKIRGSINNINTIISELRMNPGILNTINKKMKGLPTFDACGVLIGEIEKVCDKSSIPLLEEYRYWVNTAKRDTELMKIIEESLQLCLELGNFSKQNSQPQERKTNNPFGTTFFKPGWN